MMKICPPPPKHVYFNNLNQLYLAGFPFPHFRFRKIRFVNIDWALEIKHIKKVFFMWSKGVGRLTPPPPPTKQITPFFFINSADRKGVG